MKKKGLFKAMVFYLVFFAFLLFPQINFGQSVKRQCISSYGASASVGGVFISQTAGQSYNTQVTGNSNAGVSQGFQQSGTFSLQKIGSAEGLDLNLQVYPNPATYSFLIEGKELFEDYHIHVINAEGKFIMAEKLTDVMQYEMSCDTWDNGIYFITVNDAQQRKQTLKLVISK